MGQTATKLDSHEATAVEVATDALYEGRVMEAILVLTDAMPLSRALATLPPAPPALGDILVCSWGYDQTNIDFYQVVSLTKSSLRIRKIGKRRAGGGTGYDNMVPVPDAFEDSPLNRRGEGDEFTSKGALKRIGASEHYRYSVKISDYSWAYPWDGKPQHETGWGYGH